MNDIVIDLDITSAYNHFVLYGLASILDHQNDISSTQVWWIDENHGCIRVNADISWHDIAQYIYEHVETFRSSPLATITVENSKGKESLVFKNKRSSETDIQEIYALRDEHYPHDQHLQQLLAGLGEPSWWHEQNVGTTRWDNTVSNAGRNIIDNTLVICGETLINRDLKTIENGLRGISSDFEVKKGHKFETKNDVTHNLTFETHSDAARVWCSIWGFSLIPVIRDIRSHTPGYDRSNDTYTLPIYREPITINMLREALLTQNYGRMCSHKIMFHRITTKYAGNYPQKALTKGEIAPISY